jgi:acyl-CoA thioesterase-1
MGRKIRGTGGKGGTAVACAALLVVGACGESQSGDRGSASAPSSLPASSALPAIVFLGTSLTAGYGIGEDLAYPALIQQKLDSAGLRYRVVNAGVSGETSAGGLSRLEWLLKEPVAVLVLELGANDGLRGQDVDSMEANLRAIVARTRAAYPDARIVIAGMQAPPNLGPRYAQGFRRVFPRLAEETGAALIPFLLEGVAAVDSLNLPDGIHPTAAGHGIIAETVWRVLAPELRKWRSGIIGAGPHGT